MINKKDIDQCEMDGFSEEKQQKGHYLIETHKAVSLIRAAVMSFDDSENYYFREYNKSVLYSLTRLTHSQIAELNHCLM